MKNLNVLLTDGKDENTAKLAAVLRANSMNVRLCPKNGAELLHMMEISMPDVVIADSFLQHIDAVGVVERINIANPEKRPLFVVLSSIDNANFERELLKSGVDYYFLKPIDPKSVAQRIIQLTSWKDVAIPTRTEPTEDLTVAVTEILLEIGMPVHIKGYNFVREAIKLTVEDPEMLNSVTKILYPTVAKKFKSTPSRVERAIRHGIETAWNRGNVDVLNSYFGYTIQSQKGKPTNSEFIALLSDKIRLSRRKSH